MLSFGAFDYPDQRRRFQNIMTQRNGKKTQAPDDGIGDVESHFLDSGAFTQWTKAAEYARKNRCGRWDYFDTPEFWGYMDDYAKFVKKYKVAIDLYANVDVIQNPELTWRNQQYLEKKGLTPVPVVHFPEDLKWLQLYMSRGHELIGLGGLVGNDGDARDDWTSRCFDLICDQPSRLPKVKIHGFGLTDYMILLRYPWWSVDSTSWAMVGAFGSILVPHKRAGKFTFDVEPYVMAVSNKSPKTGRQGRHYHSLTEREKEIVREWLEEIGIPLGRMKGEEVVEVGVVTCTYTRRAANLHFFERMRKALPPWPQPFRARKEARLF